MNDSNRQCYETLKMTAEKITKGNNHVLKIEIRITKYFPSNNEQEKKIISWYLTEA